MREPIPGVYASLGDLARLEWRARGFSFRPRQPVHSLLAGRRASRMRGRGLDFEELQAYVFGDDVRTIDWHVTARMRKPYVRTYTEERDRPVVLVVDQRQSMFFGSRRAMKSVTAAEIAALVAWRALGQDDRVGGWVFDDRDVVEVRPQRNRRTVLALFDRILERNHALEAAGARRNGSMLNTVLEQVQRRAYHDHVIVVISDFDGTDAATKRALLLAGQRNDVLAVAVLDPTRSRLPERGRFVVSNGELQLEIDLGDRRTREGLAGFGESSVDALLAWRREIRVPVLPVWTSEDPARQLRRLLGGLPREGR